MHKEARKPVRITAYVDPVDPVETTHGTLRFCDWLAHESERLASRRIHTTVQRTHNGRIALARLP